VTAAVCAQAARLTHVSNLYYVEHRDELVERLATLLASTYAAIGAWESDRPAPGPDPSAFKSFLCNSGAEAGEGAVKLARRWGRTRRGDACFRVVAAERSFHGRTITMLAATGQASKQEDFEPLTPGFTHVPLNDIEALADVVDEHTCAVMLEPVQGEGGVYPCDIEYLQAVRTLCDERDVLLIFDEVQTGCWRTGPFLAAEAYGVRPDVVCLAKSLANGLPIGAIVARAEVADVLRPGDHGSTFGGGPVVCAAALATLTALEDEHLGANAIQTGEYLRVRLSEVAGDTAQVLDVRGRGLMNAVQLHAPVAADVAAQMLVRGLVVNSIGSDVLRILPPLVCGNAEVDTLIDALYEILPAIQGGSQ
jgi:acetylornithine/succinyldiaminopimelate/putrescine aminotransferase